MSRAQDDLRVARALADDPKAPTWVIAFHSQQAAEKAVKTVFVWKQIDYPFTHDLADLIGRLDVSLRQDRSFARAETLTQYAVASRYPGRTPDGDEARAALGIASGIVAACKSYLESQGARFD